LGRRLIATPTALTWLDAAALATLTGHPVRSMPRHPDEPNPLRAADAVVAAPATFNTINKWAAGINDTLALAILNEALGLGLPIVASPYAKPPLAAHPAFARSLDVLRRCGVHLTETEAIRPAEDGQPFRWDAVVALLRRAAPPYGERDGRE
jgi:phosphopantothenoylcysteine synthetase/decarboxylase